MILKIVLLILALVLLFWILCEAIGYVPTNIYISDDFTKEGFIASMIYQKVPSYNGDDMAVNSTLDTDVLRSLRLEEGDAKGELFSKTKELDFYQMNSLIEGIKSRQQIGMSVGDLKFIPVQTSNKGEEDIPLQKALLHLRAAINSSVLRSDFNSPYHAFQPLSLLSFTVIEKASNMQLDYLRYRLNMHLGRPYKTHTFIIYAEVIVDSGNTDDYFYISTIELIGTPVEHLSDIVNDEYRNTLFDRSSPSLDDVFQNFPIIGGYGKPNDDLAIFEAKKAHDNALKSYKCFHPKGNRYGELPYYYTQVACESYHNEIGGIGVWDKPCSSDDECPFWRANVNYENNFGGCDKETMKCQMPLGVQRVGYRKYSKHSTPFCYGCGSTNSQDCCNDQVTPDYMFEGDTQIRRQQSDILEEKGIEANPMISVNGNKIIYSS